jgi:hypothetical protein
VEFFSYVYYVMSDEQLNNGDMEIREFYLATFPADELGLAIDENATFLGLLNELHTAGDIYRYIGVSDSLIRERLFERLASELGVSYEYVYNLWLNS